MPGQFSTPFFYNFERPRPSVLALSRTREAIFSILAMSRKTPQNIQKRLPKRSPWAFQKALKTRSKKQENHTRYFIDFLPFWDPPGPPFWNHLGSKMTQKSNPGATWDPKPPQVTPQVTPGPSQGWFWTPFCMIFQLFTSICGPNLN